MSIRNLSEDVILVEVPSDGSRRADDLKNINEMISKKSASDVIIDFSKAEIINSWNISNLLILRSMLQDAGRQLILCSVSTVTKCIFVVAGLSEMFVFVEDKSAALAAIQKKDSPCTASGTGSPITSHSE
jgi:anti-anti-sigma regulatory factor